MGGKKKQTKIDFHTGIVGIVPATQEALKQNEVDVLVRKTEKDSLVNFKKTLGSKLELDLKSDDSFPTDDEVFVFIVQYFAGNREYQRRDVDNMAKTILDVLCGRLYRDDSQVKTLLVSKKIEKRVPQDFAYIAVKKVGTRGDVDALKISGIERSVTLYQELKSKGVF